MEINKEVLAKLESKAFQKILSKHVEDVLHEEMHELIQKEVKKSGALVSAVISKAIGPALAKVIESDESDYIREAVGDLATDAITKYGKSEEGKKAIAAAIKLAMPKLMAVYLKDVNLNLKW